MTTAAAEQVEFFQIQTDAWSGPAGRWVQPPGWLPSAPDEPVGVRWRRDGLSWRVEGRWEWVRPALLRMGVLAR